MAPGGPDCPDCFLVARGDCSSNRHTQVRRVDDHNPRMSGPPLRLRLRDVVSSWFWLVVLVLVAVLVVSAGVTYAAHVGADTTQRTEQATVATAAGTFAHSATVQRENPVYPVGTTLSNRSTYFRTVAPVLNGTYGVTLRSAAEADVSVALDADLVLQSADEDRVYWTDRSDLATRERADVAAGDAVSVPFTLNASAVAQRRAEIEEALGSGPGEIRSFVAVDVALEGSVAGEPTSLSYTARLPIAIADDTYSVGPSEGTTGTVQRARTVTVTENPGSLQRVGAPLVATVALGGLVGLGYARREDRLALSPAEAEALAYHRDRAEFDEWLSAVRLPEGDFAKPVAEASSLGDLVDLAIDSDAAVVEAPDGTAYVFGDDYVYAYSPPGSVDAGADDGAGAARFEFGGEGPVGVDDDGDSTSGNGAGSSAADADAGDPAAGDTDVAEDGK